MSGLSSSASNILDYLGIEESEQTAFVDHEGNSLSYSELHARVSQAQEQVQYLDSGSMRRCVTVLPDHPTTSILQLALLGNYTLIPANPASSERELRELVRSVGADCLISNSNDSLAEKLSAELSLCHLGFDRREDQSFDFAIQKLTGDKSESGAQSQAFESDSTAALILPTSGSTGDPKLVPLQLSALAKSAINIAQHLQLSASDRALHILPMFHIGAIVDLVLAPLIKGGSLCFAQGVAFNELASTATKQKVSWVQLVPTMLNRLLLESDDQQLKKLGDSLRFVRSVSSDLPPNLQLEAEARLSNTPIIQIYGMTESSGQIASNPLPPEQRREGSVGRPVGVKLCIMDSYGNPLPSEEEGEICIDGETMMQGYENYDNSKAFYGSWLRTGDLGKLDKDGFLHISGRLKEIVNRGGEKIALQEIDRVALAYEQIVEAAAFAVPHASLGEEVAIAVVPLSQELSEPDLRAYFSEYLAEHKLPRQILFLPELPKLGSGKIDRRALGSMLQSAEPEEAGHGTAEYRPTSISERLISRLWIKVLGADPPVPGDDFFDAGGDSLAATGFLAALEKATKRNFSADLLYRAPTFEKLVAAIDSAESKQVDEYQLDLPKPIFDAIRQATAAWPGRRRQANSLVIEHNTAGSKQSFFWCGNGIEHFEDMITALGPDRPSYVLRTLSGLKFKSDTNTKLLASHYVLEIEDIQPEGPICLGGFCQGAVLARQIAEQLDDRGREIKLVIFVDRVFVQPFELPTLLVWSSSSQYSSRMAYLNPEIGLPYLYPAGAVAIRHNSPHRGSVFGQGAVELVERISPYLDFGLPEPEQIGSESCTFKERAKSYRAEINSKIPRIVRSGSEISVQVEIKNTSDEDWSSTSENGFYLAARWINLDGHIRTILAGSVELNKGLAVGESVEVDIKVQVPGKKLPYFLILDMVDEGVTWFHQQENPIFKKLVFCPV